MRGINGVNDGQQIFSYDSTFSDVNCDGVKGMFTYQPPMLPAGVKMTEELALTMPQSFIYRNLENGCRAFALNTYLGRDYMGSAGRFGNHLSHVIVTEPGERLTYPCEYYGSAMLRERMSFEEVNNPEKPALLPELRLEKGRRIDIDEVIGFLDEGGRTEIFKDMFCAMLAFESRRKRLVICDERENIIMWIAALEYALPLKNALGIDFSTYDYDPSLSASRICGVVPEGTRFDAESASQHFTFDLLSGKVPRLGKNEEFFDFLETGMTLSYESIIDFHNFLIKGYDYDKANEELYDAYSLYTLLLDELDVSAETKIGPALGFAAKYAKEAENRRIMERFLEKYEQLIHVGSGLYFSIFAYLTEKYADMSPEQKNKYKTIAIYGFLAKCLDSGTDAKTLTAFYEKLIAYTEKVGIDIPASIITEDMRKKVYGVIEFRIDDEKLNFLIGVVVSELKKEHTSVKDVRAGTAAAIIRRMTEAAYRKDAKYGYFVITRILDAFSDSCDYLTAAALCITDIFAALPDGQRETVPIWNYYGRTVASRQKDGFDAACRVLMAEGRCEQLYMLCALEMENADSPEKCRTAFERHVRNYFPKDKKYKELYFEKAMTAYYNELDRLGGRNALEYKSSLFYLIAENKLSPEIADDLIKDIMNLMELGEPDQNGVRLIKTLFDYNYNVREKKIEGKPLLFITGVLLDGFADTPGNVRERLSDLYEVKKGNVDLNRINSEKSLGKYLDWIMRSICSICRTRDDFEAALGLFDMRESIASEVFTQITKFCLKKSKETRDYTLFCEFLGSVFTLAEKESCEAVGKTLGKFGKQKLLDLDDAVKARYASERKALVKWDMIYDTADSSGSLFGFSGLFKKK